MQKLTERQRKSGLEKAGVLLFWLCVWRLQVEGHNPFMYLDF